MQPNPTANAPPAAPEPPPKPDASSSSPPQPDAPPATPEPPVPPVATFPTPSSSPPYALKEMPGPAALQEKDLHGIEPRPVTIFGVQCWVVGHCIVARAEFSAIFLNHENGEVTLQTKNGLACTTGLAPDVFALFVGKQSPLAIVKPGE